MIPPLVFLCLIFSKSLDDDTSEHDPGSKLSVQTNISSPKAIGSDYHKVTSLRKKKIGDVHLKNHGGTRISRNIRSVLTTRRITTTYSSTCNIDVNNTFNLVYNTGIGKSGISDEDNKRAYNITVIMPKQYNVSDNKKVYFIEKNSIILLPHGFDSLVRFLPTKAGNDLVSQESEKFRYETTAETFAISTGNSNLSFYFDRYKKNSSFYVFEEFSHYNNVVLYENPIRNSSSSYDEDDMIEYSPNNPSDLGSLLNTTTYLSNTFFVKLTIPKNTSFVEICVPPEGTTVYVFSLEGLNISYLLKMKDDSNKYQRFLPDKGFFSGFSYGEFSGLIRIERDEQNAQKEVSVDILIQKESSNKHFYLINQNKSVREFNEEGPIDGDNDSSDNRIPLHPLDDGKPADADSDEKPPQNATSSNYTALMALSFVFVSALILKYYLSRRQRNDGDSQLFDTDMMDKDSLNLRKEDDCGDSDQFIPNTNDSQSVQNQSLDFSEQNFEGDFPSFDNKNYVNDSTAEFMNNTNLFQNQEDVSFPTFENFK